MPVWQVSRISQIDELEHLEDCQEAAWLGTVEASDAAVAIEKAAAEFRVDTWRLLAAARR
jgi:hypothetical protein